MKKQHKKKQKKEKIKGNDAYKEFKENSYWRSEDYTETTAQNTGFQSELAAYQAQNPGPVPADVIDRLKKKYKIK